MSDAGEQRGERALTVSGVAALDGRVPEVRLLDARARRLNDMELRAWARELSELARADHVSRSYRPPYALVAWGPCPLGIDIERVEPPDPAFAESICTPVERRRLGDSRFEGRVCASLWCGKEALAKALGEPLAYDPRRLDAPLLWAGQRGRWCARALEVPADYVAWLCWLGG